MLFRLRFTILIFLILSVSGCMKAAEKIVVAPSPPPPPPIVRFEFKGPYDVDIPRELQDRLRGVDAADWTIPHILLSVAGHFETGGEAGKARHFLDRAAEAFIGKRDLSGEALVFCRKVLLLLDSGLEAEALTLMREGGEKWTAPPLRAFPEYLAGRLALIRGDFARALDLLQQSLQSNAAFQADIHLLRLRRDTELAAGMAGVLPHHLPLLLTAYHRQSPMAPEESLASESRANLRAALALNRELRQTKIGPFIPTGDYQRSDAEAYAFLGLDEGMRGHGEESLRHLTYAAELSRAAGFRQGEIRSLLFMGEIGLRGVNSEEGLRAATVILERADRYRAAPYRVWARLLLARYDRDRGRIGEAIESLQEADGILTSQRSGPEAEMFAQVCRSQRRTVYEFLVELLAGEGRAGEALTAAEKAKALMTVDLLAGQEIGGTPAERELLRRETELGESIQGLQRLILQVSSETRTGELLERLQGAEEAYRDLLGRFGPEGAKLLSLVSVRGIDSAALQRLLDENTTLFDYFTTERSLYVWAVHRGMIHLERIDLSREDLRSFVFSLLEAIQSKGKKRTASLFRKAYDLLLKPVIPFVSGERIGFIPDDCLFYFPFGVMNYRGKFLADGFSIFQLPAAGLLGQVMEEKIPTGMRILAFGDPDLENEDLDLHHAVEEVKQIQKRFGKTTVLLNQQASEAKAAEMMAGYDILHFAVRGQFYPHSPLRSGLLLTPGAGQDGTLSILEIFRFRYSGRAVVLSGCDTLRETDPEGKGFTSLQRAFLHAGSPSVVSTLWLVDDKAASHLLDLFYRHLARRESPADALREAQLHLLREGYPPYVWAAFVLTGRY